MSFIDTLRAAFKGGGGARVPLARTFTSPWSWPIEASGAGRPFEYASAVRQAFLDNPVAQRAVRIVAEGAGSAPLLPADTAALRLVSATSAGQSLLETLAAHLLLHGNGYVQVMRDGSGQPVELFALRPDRVSVVPGADGWPAAYRYKAGEVTLTLPVEDEDGWPQVIHLKAFHPADDHCRPSAKGVFRQRGPCADRRPAPPRYRGAGRQPAGHSARGRMLARQRFTHWPMGRALRQPGLLSVGQLAVYRTPRRHPGSRPKDGTGDSLSGRMGACCHTRFTERRRDNRCRGESRDCATDNGPCS